MPREAREPVITRLEPLRPRGLRVRIHLDPPRPEDAPPLEVALEAVERLELGVGDSLPRPRLAALQEADAGIRVRDAALNLLSYRARTRTELRRKLREKGFDADRIEACLDRLESQGLVDDAEVAAAHVRDRLRLKPRGRVRLRSELRAKGVARGVADDVVERVLEDEEVTEADLARRAADRWVARQSDATLAALVGDDRDEAQKVRRRLYGWLGRRGFRGQALCRPRRRGRGGAGGAGSPTGARGSAGPASARWPRPATRRRAGPAPRRRW